jgi:hypothetical protein
MSNIGFVVCDWIDFLPIGFYRFALLPSAGLSFILLHRSPKK